MASIPLPALDIKPPENPLDQYAKALSVQSMISGQKTQQLQQQGLQQENQMREQQIADQKAQTNAMQEWDGKSLNDLVPLVVKHGGSAQAVIGLKSKILEQQEKYSNIAKNDAETGSKNIETLSKQNDMLAGHIDAVKDVPDEDLVSAVNREKNAALVGGYIDRNHADVLDKILASNDPQKIRGALGIFEKSLMGQKEQIDNAKALAETNKAIADTQLAGQKIKLFANSKPGDFDSQIDQVMPTSGPNYDLNKQTKVVVNTLLGKGDYEGAAKAFENATHVVNQRAETQYVQNREDYRAALARQANQSNQLQKNGLEQLDKIWTDPQHGYTQTLAQINATKSAIASAKDGNELAASLAPLMTVLGVNSFAGVHRINPQEYEAAGPGVGSIFRRINSALDKATVGKLQPDTAKEMESLMDQLLEQKHQSLVPASQLIAKNAGLDPAKTTVFDKTGKPESLDNVVQGKSTVGVTPGTPPAGATHTATGPDGKRHYLDANQKDLGVVP